MNINTLIIAALAANSSADRFAQLLAVCKKKYRPRYRAVMARRQRQAAAFVAQAAARARVLEQAYEQIREDYLRVEAEAKALRPAREPLVDREMGEMNAFAGSFNPMWGRRPTNTRELGRERLHEASDAQVDDEGNEVKL